jgi:hypothetical protein
MHILIGLLVAAFVIVYVPRVALVAVGLVVGFMALVSFMDHVDTRKQQVANASACAELAAAERDRPAPGTGATFDLEIDRYAAARSGGCP